MLYIKKVRPIFEFFAENALCWQAETVAVEMCRPFQIFNAEGNNCDAWFHDMALSLVEGMIAACI